MGKIVPEIMIILTVLLAVVTSVTAILMTVTVRNTGTVVAHGCKVYLDDETTESYVIEWGEMRVNQTLTNYRWLYNNSTVTDAVNLSWHHNADSYLHSRIYYELPDHTWEELSQYEAKTFSQGEWLHIRIELTTLPDAINHQGSFEFNLVVELE